MLSVDMQLFLHFSGGFDATQASDGWRACLNIWSGTFSADELLRFSDCEEKGDVFSMSEDVGDVIGDVNGYCVTPRIGKNLLKKTDSFPLSSNHDYLSPHTNFPNITNYT